MIYHQREGNIKKRTSHLPVCGRCITKQAKINNPRFPFRCRLTNFAILSGEDTRRGGAESGSLRDARLVAVFVRRRRDQREVLSGHDLCPAAVKGTATPAGAALGPPVSADRPEPSWTNMNRWCLQELPGLLRARWRLRKPQTPADIQVTKARRLPPSFIMDERHADAYKHNTIFSGNP